MKSKDNITMAKQLKREYVEGNFIYGEYTEGPDYIIGYLDKDNAWHYYDVPIPIPGKGTANPFGNTESAPRKFRSDWNQRQYDAYQKRNNEVQSRNGRSPDFSELLHQQNQKILGGADIQMHQHSQRVLGGVGNLLTRLQPNNNPVKNTTNLMAFLSDTSPQSRTPKVLQTDVLGKYLRQINAYNIIDQFDPSLGLVANNPRGGMSFNDFQESTLSEEITLSPKLKRAKIDLNNITYDTYLVRANELATELFNPYEYGNEARKELSQYFNSYVLSYVFQTNEGKILFGNENAAFINDFVSLVEQLYNSQYYTCFMNGGANSAKWHKYNNRIDNATTIEEKANIIREREYVEHNEYNKFYFSAQFAKDFPLIVMGTMGTTMHYSTIIKPIKMPISSRLPIGHNKQWSKMTIKERRAFQHSYDRHREELGLPNWQEKNAENLRILFNNKIRFIRNRGINSFFNSKEWHNGRMIEVYRTHVKVGNKTYYYYETKNGHFISVGILK